MEGRRATTAVTPLWSAAARDGMNCRRRGSDSSSDAGISP